MLMPYMIHLQALRDSRKNHPLQRQDSAEEDDFIISTANCKSVREKAIDIFFNISNL